MNNLLDSRTVLITGGTGSFGSTVCSNLINTKVNQEVSDKTGGILEIKLSMTFYGKD